MPLPALGYNPYLSAISVVATNLRSVPGGNYLTPSSIFQVYSTLPFDLFSLSSLS